MFSAPAAHTRLRSLLGIAVALIFVGGQLGTLVHNAFVQHRLCAEHNTLEHGDSDHDHPAAALAASDDDSQTSFRLAGAQSDSAHDHCGLTTVTRTSACQTAVSCELAGPPWRQLSRAFPSRTMVIGQATYRLAPKQSPPA